MNPYGGYDSSSSPFLYRGDLAGGDRAARPRRGGGRRGLEPRPDPRNPAAIERDDLVITWESGQNSALDSRSIADGRDIGNVVVQRNGGEGLEDVPYDISFAFAFHAFHPDAPIHTSVE